MRAPRIAPPAAPPAITAAPCPPQMLPEQPDATAPPMAAPPPAPTASPIQMLLLRRAFVLTDTRVTCCRSMDCGPLPGLTVREVSVTLSNLPLLCGFQQHTQATGASANPRHRFPRWPKFPRVQFLDISGDREESFEPKDLKERVLPAVLRDGRSPALLSSLSRRGAADHEP